VRFNIFDDEGANYERGRFGRPPTPEPMKEREERFMRNRRDESVNRRDKFARSPSQWTDRTSRSKLYEDEWRFR